MEFNDLIVRRRSVRRYDADRKVTKEQVNQIIEAVMLAPTWKNSQTGRYYALMPDEMPEGFAQSILPGFNAKRTTGAALIVTTFVKGISGFNDGEPANKLGNHWGAYDLGLQSAYFCLKAADMGLDTLIMGIRYGDTIRSALHIPENEEIVSVLALGYRAEEPVIRERLKPDDVLTFCQ